MASHLAVLILSLLLAAPGAALAQGQRDLPPPVKAAPKAKRPAEQPQPMRFEWVREGPAAACGDNCREWLSASGPITATAGKDFEAFAATLDLRGRVIVLNSMGGSLGGGLALGRAIRRLNMTVTVGQTVLLPPDASGERRASYSPKGGCASMCPFVLLGGARRHVPPEAFVSVHQIWPNDNRADAAAAQYSAQNVAVLLRAAAAMARYTVDMDGDILLFDIAMRIPPWEAARRLTRAEIMQTRLHTTDAPFAPLDMEVAAVPPPPSSDAPTGLRPVSGAQWQLIGGPGQQVIARHHALTLEGEEIGSFLLNLGCGNSPAMLSLRYMETRRLDGGTADSLRGVLVAVDQARVLLTVVSSQANGKRLESTARGVIPRQMAAKLIEPGGRLFTVATMTRAKVRTVIHVGSTGLETALPRLTAACPRQ